VAARLEVPGWRHHRRLRIHRGALRSKPTQY
jgi:hypothetical protein